MKKIISAAAALCLILSSAAFNVTHAEKIPNGDVNADSHFNLSDIITLKNFLHGKDIKIDSEEADLNLDKTIDIYDFIQIRGKLLKLKTDSLNQSGLSEDSSNITAGIEASVHEKGMSKDFQKAHSIFALNLLKTQTKEKGNMMISPYSVAQAVGMLANGADGNTLSEIEKAMGDMPLDDLNNSLSAWNYSNSTGDIDDELKTANSIWLRDGDTGITLRPQFVQDTIDFYKAEIFKSSFNNYTVNDVNSWISEKTLGMIPQMLDSIDDDSVMFLINATAFESQWENKFDKSRNMSQVFTNYLGNEQYTSMLCSKETALDDGNVKCFFKPYKGGKYTFAAIMPDGDTDINEFIQSMTPDSFRSLLSVKDNKNKLTKREILIPKFKCEYKSELNQAFADMGMISMFSAPDFSRMTTGEYPAVSRVLHDTFIQFDEEGTRAAAATVIEMKNSIPMPSKDAIIFNRPFLYAIIDTEVDLPVFVGTLSEIPETAH